MSDTSGDDREAVLAEGAVRFRDLPWRRTRDPWAVLVSEVMLHQTQVARVVPRWERFLLRWPTPAACAEASLGEVLSEWQGLGYPRRGRDLRRAAAVCVDRYGGAVPAELHDLLELPGVGPYTARAVLVFAHERELGVVDTNIARVLARRANRSLRPGEAQAAADSWVPAGRSWEWNQILMDLGATRCRPRPDCEGCPVSCAWRDAGHPLPDPAVGTAGASRRQAPYDGSDRQLRGIVLAGVLDGPARPVDQQLVDHVGQDRIAAVVESLVADGLVARDRHGRLVGP